MTDHQGQAEKQYEAPTLVRIAGIDEVTLGGGFSGLDHRSMKLRPR